MRQDEFQKAKRISRAIQDYIESTGANGIRSTDIYPYLCRKGLVEKDLNNGLKFRQFLKKLYGYGVLSSTIPQCKPQKSASSEKSMEWYFYKVNSNNEKKTKSSESNITKSFRNITSDNEADVIIKKLNKTIEALPKKHPSSFTYNEQNIRKLYPRAYEKWSVKELEIANIAWKIFKKIDKVAKLLKRQPSSVEKRLKNENLL